MDDDDVVHVLTDAELRTAVDVRNVAATRWSSALSALNDDQLADELCTLMYRSDRSGRQLARTVSAMTDMLRQGSGLGWAWPFARPVFRGKKRFWYVDEPAWAAAAADRADAVAESQVMALDVADFFPSPFAPGNLPGRSWWSVRDVDGFRDCSATAGCLSVDPEQGVTVGPDGGTSAYRLLPDDWKACVTMVGVRSVGPFRAPTDVALDLDAYVAAVRKMSVGDRVAVVFNVPASEPVASGRVSAADAASVSVTLDAGGPLVPNVHSVPVRRPSVVYDRRTHDSRFFLFPSKAPRFSKAFLAQGGTSFLAASTMASDTGPRAVRNLTTPRTDAELTFVLGDHMAPLDVLDGFGVVARSRDGDEVSNRTRTRARLSATSKVSEFTRVALRRRKPGGPPTPASPTPSQLPSGRPLQSSRADPTAATFFDRSVTRVPEGPFDRAEVRERVSRKVAWSSALAAYTAKDVEDEVRATMSDGPDIVTETVPTPGTLVVTADGKRFRRNRAGGYDAEAQPSPWPSSAQLANLAARMATWVASAVDVPESKAYSSTAASVRTRLTVAGVGGGVPPPDPLLRTGRRAPTDYSGVDFDTRATVMHVLRACGISFQASVVVRITDRVSSFDGGPRDLETWCRACSAVISETFADPDGYKVHAGSDFPVASGFPWLEYAPRNYAGERTTVGYLAKKVKESLSRPKTKKSVATLAKKIADGVAEATSVTSGASSRAALGFRPTPFDAAAFNAAFLSTFSPPTTSEAISAYREVEKVVPYVVDADKKRPFMNACPPTPLAAAFVVASTRTRPRPAPETDRSIKLLKRPTPTRVGDDRRLVVNVLVPRRRGPPASPVVGFKERVVRAASSPTFEAHSRALRAYAADPASGAAVVGLEDAVSVAWRAVEAAVKKTFERGALTRVGAAVAGDSPPPWLTSFARVSLPCFLKVVVADKSRAEDVRRFSVAFATVADGVVRPDVLASRNARLAAFLIAVTAASLRSPDDLLTLLDAACVDNADRSLRDMRKDVEDLRDVVAGAPIEAGAGAVAGAGDNEDVDRDRDARADDSTFDPDGRDDAGAEDDRGDD